MMDNNNWRPTPPAGVGGGGTEAALDGGDWRAQLPPESRDRIVNKIMEALKRHLPVSGPEGLQELKKIAVRMEEKIYTAAISQSDYLRKISLKMLTMETKSQNTIPNALPSNPAGNSSKDPGHQQSSVPQSTQSMLQQHQGLRQHQSQQAVHQQQASLSQQPMLTSQQQQQHQLSSQQMMKQNQLVGQQNNMGDMQQQPQQQLMPQQNNLTNIHPQQMAPQSNIPGLNQQQQMVGSQSGNSSMQVGQHQVHVLQQSKVPVQQQIQGGASNLLASQGQQSQAQPMQQQLMSQVQQQPGQLQQQVGLQQQANLLQRDMHQRLQASGSLAQQQNVIDQQKQLYPSQRPLSETSTMSTDSSAQTGNSAGGDWQEEAYQKLESMREAYLPELNEKYQKISTKLQQHESLPRQPKSDQLDKLKNFKLMLERVIATLQVKKADIAPSFKEKLVHYDKQIINFLNTSRHK